MQPLKIETLDASQRAVIEYLYSFHPAPKKAAPLEEKARGGLSILMNYVAVIASREPANRAYLPALGFEDDFRSGRLEQLLVSDFFVTVLQRVLTDEKNTPGTHPYATPLVLPPNCDGEEPEHMPRFTLHMTVMSLLFSPLEGVHQQLWLEWGIVRHEIKKLIEEHFERDSGPSETTE